MTVDKKMLFLILFGLLVFGLRLFNINEAIYDDESNFAYSLTVMDEYGFNHDYSSPQPFNLLYKPFVALFGLQTWVFRIVPWLFGIINTVFVYVFAGRNWDKNVAFWAAFLMLISFYPTLASLQFDVEGNLVMFSVMLMFFSYLEYEKSTNAKRRLGWQILAGIGLGLAVTCKYNSIYIIIPIALYSLIRRQWNLRKSFDNLFMIYLVGFLIFLILIVFAAVVSSNWLEFVPLFSWADGFESAYSPEIFSLLGISMLVLWSTPLLFGFYIIALCKRDKNHFLFQLWISTAILFYSIVITYGSIDRYLMNTIPAMAIIGGTILSKITLTKRQLMFFSTVGIMFLGLFFYLNSLNIKYVARFPDLYFNELKSFNFNFLLSYTSASGPTFGVNFATILISFSLAFLSLLFFILLKKKHASSIFFMIFLMISISFNIFLVSEYLFHPTGVDVSDVKWKMINHVKENNLPYPIYTNDQGIQWYFEHDYLWQNKITQGFGDNEIGSDNTIVLNHINKDDGTILLLHWPPLPEKSPAWEVVSLCKADKQFYSRNVLIGEVYRCDLSSQTFLNIF